MYYHIAVAVELLTLSNNIGMLARSPEQLFRSHALNEALNDFGDEPFGYDGGVDE